MTRWLRVSAGLVPVALSIASCNGLGALGTAACPELRPDVDALGAEFSPNAAINAKMRSFVQATKDIASVAEQAEQLATDACVRMGVDLGLSPQQLTPREGQGGRARGACDALSARIAEIQAQGVAIRAQITPPSCQADVQAEARCNGTCQVEVDPGQIVATCDPARLSGYCYGNCGGSCDGSCYGACEGNCSARDASGQCAGACQGTCRGRCDAVCHARCEGTWQAPRCEGYVQGPQADAQCQASCRAHADVRAQCTPGAVQVQVSQNTQAAAALAATLQANLPRLLFAQIALGQRLAGDIDTVVSIGQDLPRIVGAAGANVLACIAAATDVGISASVKIDVTVQASAGVSGRVGS